MKKIVLFCTILSVIGIAIWSVYLINNKEKSSEIAVAAYKEAETKNSKETSQIDNSKNDKAIEEEVKKEDKVDKNKTGDNEKAKDQNSNAERAVISYNYESGEKIVDGTYKQDGKKVAFLTFDDGPSSNITPKILDYLKEKNIKATFFVLGKNIDGNEESAQLLRRMVKEGHVIANHTYSHDYNKLYPNENTDVKVFMEEVDKTNELIKKAVGEDYKVSLVRMPHGYITRVHNGDKNLWTFKNELRKREMHSMDWNCLTEDAVGKEKTPEELLAFLKRTAGNKEKLLILMHDSKARNNTYEGLPKIVDYLQSQGYEFAVFDKKK